MRGSVFFCLFDLLKGTSLLNNTMEVGSYLHDYMHSLICLYLHANGLQWTMTSSNIWGCHGYYRPGFSSLRGQGHFHFAKGSSICFFIFHNTGQKISSAWKLFSTYAQSKVQTNIKTTRGGRRILDLRIAHN